jgi:putative oxidoreductase
MAIASSVNRSQSVAVAPAAAAPIVLLGRLLFSVVFLHTAQAHFSSGTIAYAASQGVPAASILVPLSGIIAILGGLSILLGYRARIGAWLIVLFLVPVTLSMHQFWKVADPMMHLTQLVNFLKNASLLGGALLITQFGSGPWSLDARK